MIDPARFNLHTRCVVAMQNYFLSQQGHEGCSRQSVDSWTTFSLPSDFLDADWRTCRSCELIVYYWWWLLVWMLCLCRPHWEWTSPLLPSGFKYDRDWRKLIKTAYKKHSINNTWQRYLPENAEQKHIISGPRILGCHQLPSQSIITYTPSAETALSSDPHEENKSGVSG